MEEREHVVVWSGVREDASTFVRTDFVNAETALDAGLAASKLTPCVAGRILVALPVMSVQPFTEDEARELADEYANEQALRAEIENEREADELAQKDE